MKPVKNVSKSFFEVGRHYMMGSSRLTIKAIKPCYFGACRATDCNRAELWDTDGNMWCSQESKFKEIPKRRTRR